MAHSAALTDLTTGIRPIPLHSILPWAVFALALLFVGVYIVGIEQGATSLVSGSFVHEFVHDARHLAGLPCH